MEHKDEINKYIGNKIRYFRKKRKLTLEELSKIIDIPRSTLNNYELGNREADKSTLFQLATFFEISIDELFPSTIDGNYIRLDSTREHHNIISVYGRICAGNGITAYEEVIDDIINPYPRLKGDLIALQVVGDSMDKIIPNGVYAIIKLQPEVEFGQIAAVIIDGEDAMLKRIFRLDNDTLMLKPESNQEHRPITFVGDEINQIKIVGKYVGFVSPYIEN